MNLINTYEKFKHINEEFIAFIDKLVIENFESFTDEQIKMNLNIALKNYEKLKFEADEIKVEACDKNNLNDLNYAILAKFPKAKPTSNFAYSIIFFLF